MITVEWDTEQKNVVLLRYADPVPDWSEYQDAVADANRLAAGYPGKTYLVHLAGKVKMPAGNPFPQLRAATRKTVPNVDTVIMVVDNLMARRILELVMRGLTGVKTKFVRTLDESRAYVREQEKVNA